MASTNKNSPASETFIYFLRLGFLGFGGPLALVASMRRDLVEKDRWIEAQEFDRSFALIKALPGPVAFMTAVYLGRRRAGAFGGLLAAVALNFPAFILMILFGALYSRWQGVGGAQAFLNGMQAAALGLILASLKGLGFAHRKKPLFWILAAFAALLTAREPAREPFLIVGCGIFTASLFWLKTRNSPFGPLKNLKLGLAPLLNTPVLADSAYIAVTSQASFSELAWCCFKSGAFIFGSGLAIVPLMESDFVQRLHWLTHHEFMDALAFGQVTPGPVVITATFIGFKALGVAGATVATLAIFAAPFFHMMTWFPIFSERLSRMPWISAFLTGAIAAVVGAIFATSVRLAAPWLGEPFQFVLIAATLGLALFSKAPAWALIPAGGLAASIAAWLVNPVA